MLDEREMIFTTGEFAAKAGITVRTLRYYDKINLLKPSSHSRAGNRLYSIEDFARLQKILTLKLIGLSLDEIADNIRYDVNDTDFKNSLDIQKQVMEEKVQHMHAVIKAIDETVHMLENDKVMNWDKFINIINIINIDKNWTEQYRNASNLKARIRIHELFSTNKQGWMPWYFEQLNIPERARILELGCGDGNFWARNIERIPEGWDVILTDFSQGMLKDAKKNLKSKDGRFKYKIVDAEDITFPDESFDAVIANHMLYHVADIEKAFSEIKRVLKKGGYFYASTVGKDHMAQMREMVTRFDFKLMAAKSFHQTERFQLENGLKEVSNWFRDVKLKRYEDNLIVTEPGPLVDYIFSMLGNVKESFDKEKMKQFYDFLGNEITRSKGMFITKDTGFFEARK